LLATFSLPYEPPDLEALGVTRPLIP